MRRTALAAFTLMCAATSAHAQGFSSEDLARRTVERGAVAAAIWSMPIVSVDAMRHAFYTAPGKPWFTFIRFHGPEKALFDKT